MAWSLIPSVALASTATANKEVQLLVQQQVGNLQAKNDAKFGVKKNIFSCVLQATAVAAVSGMERELTGWFVRRESDVARAVASAVRCLVSLERAITRLPSKNVHQTVLGAGAFIRLTSKLMFMFLLSYDGPLPLW